MKDSPMRVWCAAVAALICVGGLANRSTASGLDPVGEWQREVAAIPMLGRWQEFAYSDVAVGAVAAKAYAAVLADLDRHHRLDDDPLFQARASRIASGIIAQAIVVKPEAVHWKWELHTTSGSSYDALSMASGKILIGSAYAKRLGLSDGELAALIAHEVAHIVAEHEREGLSEVFFLNPASLPLDSATALARLDSTVGLQIHFSELSKMQEAEADQLGMLLAHAAGWPFRTLVDFYSKLAANERSSVYSWSHPSAASRLDMAHALQLLFE